MMSIEDMTRRFAKNRRVIHLGFLVSILLYGLTLLLYRVSPNSFMFCMLLVHIGCVSFGFSNSLEIEKGWRRHKKFLKERKEAQEKHRQSIKDQINKLNAEIDKSIAEKPERAKTVYHCPHCGVYRFHESKGPCWVCNNKGIE